MPRDVQHTNGHTNGHLTGHAARNAKLRAHSLERAQGAPPLARLLVEIRAGTLGMTRLEFARKSGIPRGTLRDVELGVHTPTRRVLQQFVDYSQHQAVPADLLEELRRLYAGPGETLEQLIARLELKAGSSRELAQRVGISPATLWEYRRGNFPLPPALLRRLCEVVGEDSTRAQELWFEQERQRLIDRGYPESLAEFWTLCTREGYAEKHLLGMQMSMATVRRLRYLELPDWAEVEPIARKLCRDDAELRRLRELWGVDQDRKPARSRANFGTRLQQLRKLAGVSRRELADLFGIGGKKPARIVKYIEEDGFYSAQAFPAGLAALVTEDLREQAKLLDLWRQRRQLFHRRHRPETRIDLRLTRELYGFEPLDMEPILGYTSLEYQRIERGVSAVADTARTRILDAIHLAGRRKVAQLLGRRQQRDTERTAWQSPLSVQDFVTRLAKREGGVIPLGRLLRKAGVKGLWNGRLRAIAHGEETPVWTVLVQIAKACGVTDLTEVHQDWQERFRTQLEAECKSPLSVELRLLIAENAPTLRAFGPRLGFNYSVLVRDLQRIEREEPLKWFHIERILRAADVSPEDERWRQVRALWATSTERKKRAPEPNRNGKQAHV